MNRLTGDLNKQSMSPAGLILGVWITKLGLSAMDRDINRRVKQFRDYAFEIIKEKIDQLQSNNIG
jgi:hypothetical protein